MKPRKHAEIIKKWADGYIVQIEEEGGGWSDIKTPAPVFFENRRYRVKPRNDRVYFSAQYPLGDSSYVVASRYEEEIERSKKDWWDREDECVIVQATVKNGQIVDVSIVERKTPLID